MKVKFTNDPLKDSLLIEAESNREIENLKRWNNCVLSAMYKYPSKKGYDPPSLLIVKET